MRTLRLQSHTGAGYKLTVAKTEIRVKLHATATQYTADTLQKFAQAVADLIPEDSVTLRGHFYNVGARWAVELQDDSRKHTTHFNETLTGAVVRCTIVAPDGPTSNE